MRHSGAPVRVEFGKYSYVLRATDAERVELLRQSGFVTAAQTMAETLNIGPRTAAPLRVGQGVGRDDE